jgi:carboxypeptidase family protein
MRKLALGLLLFAPLLFPVARTASVAGASLEEKTTAVKGVVYRGDKDHPVADAEVLLLDDKKAGEKNDGSVGTKTDAKGEYAFERVAAGKYTVSIRTFYDTQEEAPCQLLAAKTKDKDSVVLVMKEKDKFVEQVFIKNFSVKAGKEVVRDFDIACKGLFGE